MMPDTKEKNGKNEKTRAVVFLADGFEEIEAMTIADILRRAEIPTELVSIMGRIETFGSHGIKIICDSEFCEARNTIEEAEILILPGGGEGTENLRNHAELGEALKWFNDNGRLVAAICAAPSVLGGLGILEGKRAACYPGFESQLSGAEISNENVVVSENTITSRAAGTAAEFTLKIVELLVNRSGLDGAKVSAKLKEQMYYSF